MRNFKFLFLLTFYLFCEIHCEPIVQIKNGQMRGTVGYSRDGRKFYKFMGIPYGHVPRRFQPAQPSKIWEGILDATKAGAYCITYNTFKYSGSENCLHMNIFTPKAKYRYQVGFAKEDLLPVFVYIHNEGFHYMDFIFDGPEYFMDEDVVLVRFEYRLNIFGFLNAGTAEAQGNQGLKDQALALRFIRENIKMFGGNPDRVTIFGNSAGASAVNFHQLSPMSRGLFKNAISLSGTSLAPFALQRDPDSKAKLLASLVDCPTSDVKYMVNCLAKIDSDYLINAWSNHASNTSDYYKNLAGFQNDFVPTIEINNGLPKEQTFMSENPYKTLKDGNYLKVPWMLGVVSHEGYLFGSLRHFKNRKINELENRHWGRVLPKGLFYEKTAPDPARITKDIDNFYFPNLQWKNNSIIRSRSFENLTNLLSDRWIFHSTRKAAKMYSKNAPTFLFFFDEKGPSALNSDKDPEGLFHPTHGDTTFYLFRSPMNIKYSTKFHKFSKSLIQLFISFNQNDRPTAIWNKTDEWDPLSLRTDFDTLKWYRLNEEPQLLEETDEFKSRMEFWEYLDLAEQDNYTVYD